MSSEGGFEVEAADGEAVDVSGNVEGLFPIVLRFAEWAPMKTSANFEVEAAKGFDASTGARYESNGFLPVLIFVMNYSVAGF